MPTGTNDPTLTQFMHALPYVDDAYVRYAYEQLAAQLGILALQAAELTALTDEAKEAFKAASAEMDKRGLKKHD